MSRRLVVAVLLAIASIAGCGASRDDRIVWITSVRYAAGDSVQWSGPRWDDSHWSASMFWRLPRPRGVLWVRARTFVPVGSARPLGVFVSALASHELWWDGVRIGQGGSVGADASSEVAGPVEALHPVPDSLAQPGEHSIALRSSAFHQGFSPASSYWSLGVGPVEALALQRERGAWIALISLSGILFAALFAIATFALNRRDRAALLLGGVGLATGLLLTAEVWRPLTGYAYDHHVVRLLVLAGITWLVCALLSAFLVVRFPRPGGRKVLLAIVVAISMAPFVVSSWDDKLAAMHFVALAFAVGWTLLALLARHRGAIPALIGSLIALGAMVAGARNFLDRWFFYAMDSLLACLTLGHLLEWREQLTAQTQALARSARLEAELLRRHLQPHFVMNTLTAIAGWIEEDPPTAVRMIDVLGDEFRALTRISDRTLVPLADELSLCRAHLETMSLRRDMTFSLETDGCDDRAMVPPALIHTLVENAVTHGATGSRDVIMRLSARCASGRTHYTFTSPAGDEAIDVTRAGTGTRYMTSRLREAFEDDWTMTQAASDGAWRVEIDVPDGSP